jgi:hypothetical protein
MSVFSIGRHTTRMDYRPEILWFYSDPSIMPCHAGIRQSIDFPPFSPPKYAEGVPQIPDDPFQCAYPFFGMAHNRKISQHSRRNGPMIPFLAQCLRAVARAACQNFSWA